MALTIDMTIPGILLAGGWRTQEQLDHMSSDDQRNTLIVAIGSLSTDSSRLQGWDNTTLVGKGATIVFLRKLYEVLPRHRTSDDWLKTTLTDDHRNALITMNGQYTGRKDLQGLTDQANVGVGLHWLATEMDGPTPAQVLKAQTNLKNMQALNDWIQLYGQPKILNAYLLLSEVDNADVGMTVMLNVLEGAFWAIGSEFGPGGNFAASFLSGMVVYWATDAPPSLNTSFSSYLSRFVASAAAVDLQLATYHDTLSQDPKSIWNLTFLYNGSTSTIGDLANIDCPTEEDAAFVKAGQAAVLAIDQNLWTYMLQQQYSILKSPPFLYRGTQDNPPIAWAQQHYIDHPSSYLTWVWEPGSSGCSGNPAGWGIVEYTLFTPNHPLGTDGELSADASHYFFIDSTPGTVTNPAGLFTRAAAFQLPIPPWNVSLTERPTYFPYEMAEEMSFGSLRAIKEGRTLSALARAEGRKNVEMRLIAKCKEDAQFAYELQRRPRKTIEEFLGVKIPERVGVVVIEENPRLFALVVPFDLPEV